jgi:hypothetical protein
MCKICDKFGLKLLKLRDYKLKDKINKKPEKQRNTLARREE